MSMKYDGFTIAQMLSFMGQGSNTFSLSAFGDGKYQLCIFSNEHGDSVHVGILFHVVMSAFKPFREQARIERKQFSANIASALLSNN